VLKAESQAVSLSRIFERAEITGAQVLHSSRNRGAFAMLRWVRRRLRWSATWSTGQQLRAECTGNREARRIAKVHRAEVFITSGEALIAINSSHNSR
jgi:hypothetical protein